VNVAPAIVVRNVGKRFRRYRAQRPRTLQEAFQRAVSGGRPSEYVWSLQDISFELPRGRAAAIIGANGAGKSTLLRLVGGVGRPDCGTIQVQGRLGALLELGAGLHPELTGRENIFVAGVIGGLTRREVERKFDSIVEFAELQEFVDSPMHAYSTGMQLRLAFATAVHIEPEVLLIDEVLSVGDFAFQRKCLDRISSYRATGCTILLVTHDMETVRRFCDEAILLRAGRMAARGAVDDVVEQYLAGGAMPTSPADL
jgi:lipopolysaccharide transport system ATP-binding protein